MEDLGFINPILENGFNTAAVLMDKDNNSQISQDEIDGFLERFLDPSETPWLIALEDTLYQYQWSLPVPEISPNARQLNGDLALNNHVENLRNLIGGAAAMVIDGFDRDSDEEISLGEVTAGVRLLITQAIEVVDQNGDQKVSPNELVKATDPDTLSDAVMSFYDADGDGELRLVDLKSVVDKYTSSGGQAGAIRDWADDIREAIRNVGNAAP